MPNNRDARLEVIIVGAGVAGLEAALALRRLAPEHTAVTVISPELDFTYRPQRVREPFAGARAEQIPLEQIATEAGFRFVRDTVSSVEAATRTVRTSTGAEYRGDALILAPGGVARSYFAHATAIDDRRLDEQLHGLVQDLEGGYLRSLAFVIPSPMAWPLPVYELALMAARRAWDMDVECRVELITPEPAPLACLGPTVSAALARVLSENRVVVRSSAQTEIPEPGLVQMADGERIRAQRIIALPRLLSPAIPGVPATGPDGFIEVDEHGKVKGVEDIWAAGDATAFPVKHGGLAAQQADAAAESVAALAGASVEPRPFDPTVEAMLIGDARPLYIRASLAAGGADVVSREPLWAPPGKIAARYLGPFLDSRRASSLP